MFDLAGGLKYFMQASVEPQSMAERMIRDTELRLMVGGTSGSIDMAF